MKVLVLLVAFLVVEVASREKLDKIDHSCIGWYNCHPDTSVCYSTGFWWWQYVCMCKKGYQAIGIHTCNNPLSCRNQHFGPDDSRPYECLKFSVLLSEEIPERF